jgi:ferredoxin-NADP reductase
LDSFKVVLTRVRTLSESTRDFRFVREDGSELEFVPGQFYRFVFADEKGEFERSYSLCNFDADSTRQDMDLVISTVDGGRASKLLFTAEPGLEAQVTGPFGRLVLPDEMPRRLFLVATSVGIAPYMPMLDALKSALEQTFVEVHLLYGVRDYSEFIYGDFLNGFSQSYKNFHLHLCVSRCDVDANQTESQHKGYVQAKLMQLTPNPESDHIMLCGNPNMIDEAYPKLKELGFKVKQVVREKYVFAKDKTPSKSAGEMSAEQKQLLADKMKKYQNAKP